MKHRVRWRPAMLMALAGVSLVGATSLLSRYIHFTETLAAVAFAALLISIPLALYFSPLYFDAIKQIWDAIKQSWRLAPFRKSSSLLLVLALSFLLLSFFTHRTAVRLAIPSGQTSVEFWANGGYVGFNRIYGIVDRIWFRTEPHPLIQNLGMSKSFSRTQSIELFNRQWVRHSSIMSPIWPAELLLAIPFIVSFCLGFYRRILRDSNSCDKCSYDLTGNVSGVCPECGTKIDDAAALRIISEIHTQERDKATSHPLPSREGVD